jgi:hypothetical protein
MLKKIEEEEKLSKKLDEVIDLMKENAPEYGVLLYLPHAMENVLKKVAEAAKWLSLMVRAKKIVKLTKDLDPMLSYKLDNPCSDTVQNYIYGKDIFAVLISVDGGANIENALAKFVEKVSMPSPAADEDGNRISGLFQPRILCPLIVRYNEDDEVEEEVLMEDSTEETFRLSGMSNRASVLLSNERSVLIPPLWTPANHEGNAVLKYLFFRKVR